MEVEISRIMVQSQPRKIVPEILSAKMTRAMLSAGFASSGRMHDLQAKNL
jgi:hypothetical protein